MQFDFSVDINRSPSEVFAYLTDLSKLPEWQSGVIRAQWEGAPGPGARAKQVREFRGKEMESELHVSKYEQDRRFAVNSSSGPITFALDYRLQPGKTGGTHLIVTGEGEASGVAKMAGPLMGRKVEKRFKEDFETLKRNVEAGR